MSVKQQNRFEAQKTVLECMKKNRSVWQGDENIAESAEYIERRISYLQTLFDGHENHGTAAQTEAKNQFIDAIARRSYVLAKRLTVYARKGGKTALLLEVDRPQRYFDNGSEATRLAHCANIVKLANENLADLAGFKVTVADVAALSADLEKARPLSARRNELAAEGRVITGTLAEVLNEVTLKLGELDDEIIAFIEDETFVDTYFAARRVYDRRGRGEAKEAPAKEA